LQNKRAPSSRHCTARTSRSATERR
jgi:hypothetical protein